LVREHDRECNPVSGGGDKVDLTAIYAGSASAAYGVNDMLIEITNLNLRTSDILW